MTDVCTEECNEYDRRRRVKKEPIAYALTQSWRCDLGPYPIRQEGWTCQIGVLHFCWERGYPKRVVNFTAFALGHGNESQEGHPCPHHAKGGSMPKRGSHRKKRNVPRHSKCVLPVADIFIKRHELEHSEEKRVAAYHNLHGGAKEVILIRGYVIFCTEYQ